MSVTAFRELLYARVDKRVRRELMEKVETFNILIEHEAKTYEDNTIREKLFVVFCVYLRFF
ncbi:MAG: hypothetical protein AAFX46_03080 [Cyanobacteria bacterium J06636_27]